MNEEIVLSDEIVGLFPWPSATVTGRGAQCQISVRGGHVYIAALHQNSGTVRQCVNFKPHELPLVIEALQKAQEKLT